MRHTHRMDLSTASSRDLLTTYAQILTSLIDRNVTRSRNAPVGDVAEFLVAKAYGGTLAAPSEKSWDVRSADGRTLQVKARLVVPGKKGTQQYSPFRSWQFDACIFVTFDAFTYDVLEALEVLPKAIQSLASPVPHLGATAMRVHTKSPLAATIGALDVTNRLQAALEALD